MGDRDFALWERVKSRRICISGVCCCAAAEILENPTIENIPVESCWIVVRVSYLFNIEHFSYKISVLTSVTGETKS